MVKGNEKLEIVTTQHPYSHEQLLLYYTNCFELYGWTPFLGVLRNSNHTGRIVFC